MSTGTVSKRRLETRPMRYDDPPGHTRHAPTTPQPHNIMHPIYVNVQCCPCTFGSLWCRCTYCNVCCAFDRCRRRCRLSHYQARTDEVTPWRGWLQEQQQAHQELSLMVSALVTKSSQLLKGLGFKDGVIDCVCRVVSCAVPETINDDYYTV
jgi:hypothetical protein